MVDINKVYERVLFLANKEQRGYITPDEFNSYADQSQLEIFESYFLKKVTAGQSPESDDEYSDLEMTVEERLTYFDNAVDVSEGNIGQSGQTVTGFPYPSDFYSLGQVLVTSGGRQVMADEVSHRDATYVNLSPLTAPTEKQCIYTRHEGGVVLYPSSIEQIRLVYLRRPGTPEWDYMPNTMGEPIYNAAGSTHFDLHPAEEFNLVYRILTMSGITIKQPDVTQYAASKES